MYNSTLIDHDEEENTKCTSSGNQSSSSSSISKASTGTTRSQLKSKDGENNVDRPRNHLIQDATSP